MEACVRQQAPLEDKLLLPSSMKMNHLPWKFERRFIPGCGIGSYDFSDPFQFWELIILEPQIGFFFFFSQIGFRKLPYERHWIRSVWFEAQKIRHDSCIQITYHLMDKDRLESKYKNAQFLFAGKEWRCREWTCGHSGRRRLGKLRK